MDDELLEVVPSPPLTPDHDDNEEPAAIIITNQQPLYDLNVIADQPFLYDLNAIQECLVEVTAYQHHPQNSQNYLRLFLLSG